MEIHKPLADKKIWFLGILAVLTVSVIIVAVASSPSQNTGISPDVSAFPSSENPNHFILPSANTPEPVGSATQSSGGKGDPGYYQEVEQGINQAYPLYQYLPVESPDFSVHYTKRLALEITLKTATDSAKQKALDWIRSKGVDPATHQITYK